MIVKNLIHALSEHDYKIAKIEGGDYTFLCKTNNEEISTIVIIDDIKYPKLADTEQCESINKSFENTFLLRGYIKVETLFLILTDKPYGFKNFSEGKFLFWVADLYSERLLSFMENDVAFDHLRTVIEESLSKPVKKSFTVKNRALRNFLSQPFVTVTLIIINILIFIYKDMILDFIDQQIFLVKYSNISTVTFSAKQYYRLFTCTFLHSDFSHLASNMMSLFFVGYYLEPIMGHIKYIILYLLSGIFASVCSVVYFTGAGVTALCIGASGAVFGVLGAYVTFALLGRFERYQLSIPRILLMVGLALFGGMQNTNIDNAAHIGGIIFGSILAYIYCISSKNKI